MSSEFRALLTVPIRCDQGSWHGKEQVSMLALLRIPCIVSVPTTHVSTPHFNPH